ncbi:hypothetical protein HPC62_12400 [Thermoleptolyngbya sichuanensis A183]|uniref:Uncharacterized protein n=1 Tax=Thermoleptolyngbya sichuanensis A183 TaxID=2737172 RepID=A0A6M8B8R7_9CYAN|nr:MULTISPECIES: hypothetical protein [Thermoleptolyngbya]QKD82878.1 hypothetical protein HPC62_12400 [Thermoleptolyngbya sichuanensis A183]
MPSLQSPLLSFLAALVLSTATEAPAVAQSLTQSLTQSRTSSAPPEATAEPAHPIAELWQQH